MNRRKTIFLTGALLLALCLSACGAAGRAVSAPESAQPEPAFPPAAAESLSPAEAVSAPEAARQEPVEETEEKELEKSLRMRIDETEVTVEWEENESVTALEELAAAGPLTVRMSMYGGFEQVGPLGTELPRNDGRTTTQSGDIMLYTGNQIVVFYGSNSWAYTRLGRITEPAGAGLAELLSNGDVTIALLWE